MRALVLLLAACATPDEALVVTAEELEDRLVVRVGGEVFTEYRFASSQKYPYFFPVNGPRSGRSVTTESAEPYPHHHSLFFACDRVNGGNYWQEGLDRGQIVHEGLRVERSSGKEVVFVARSRWQRPGAAAPFRDERRVTVSAPHADLRLLDIEITWTALERVRIGRTNHALFASRVAAELAPTCGGILADATGAQGEKATFGRTAPWIDCSGRITPEHVEGIAILVHPANPWTPTPWFTRDYGFFSPTPMHWLPKAGLELDAGTALVLRYLVVVHAGTAADAGIAGHYQRWGARLPACRDYGATLRCNSVMQPDLTSRIQRAAKRLVERGATAVYLFGSSARGEEREDSDVDIAVSGLPPTVFFRAMAEASRIVGKDVDLFALDDDEISRSLASSGDWQRVL